RIRGCSGFLSVVPGWRSPGAAMEKPRESEPRAGNVESNPVQTGARSDVERLAIRVAKRDIAHNLRGFDRPEMSTLASDDPDARRAGCIEISLRGYAQAIRPARQPVRGSIKENDSRTDRSVISYRITYPDFLAGIGNIEELFVWRKGQPVGPGEILNDQLQRVALHRSSRFQLTRSR